MRIKASLLDLGMCVSGAADLVSPLLVDHHRRTAFLTARIGSAMGLDPRSLGRAVLAASLHDIGALSLGERLRALDFDIRVVEHAEPGYRLLREFAPFSDIAPIVRCHHVEWADGRGRTHLGEPVPDESHVLFLADRIAVLIDHQLEMGEQTAKIAQVIAQARGSRFWPDAVDAFSSICADETLWGPLPASGTVFDAFNALELPVRQPVDVDVDSFSRMLAHVVDFRSPYTAAHSTGVAASAEELSRVMGMSVKDMATMRVAGHLHDLGKLAVPKELLEKPARLSPEEARIVRRHARLTGTILGSIPELSRVADWACHHHERPDGTGYPDHLEGQDLAFGARVIAACDVFTALSEERPYRPALGRGRVVRSLRHMGRVRHLDGRVVETLLGCVNQVREAREDAQRRACERHRHLVST